MFNHNAYSQYVCLACFAESPTNLGDVVKHVLAQHTARWKMDSYCRFCLFINSAEVFHQRDGKQTQHDFGYCVMSYIRAVDRKWERAIGKEPCGSPSPHSRHRYVQDRFAVWVHKRGLIITPEKTYKALSVLKNWSGSGKNHVNTYKKWPNECHDFRMTIDLRHYTPYPTHNRAAMRWQAEISTHLSAEMSKSYSGFRIARKSLDIPRENTKLTVHDAPSQFNWNSAKNGWLQSSPMPALHCNHTGHSPHQLTETSERGFYPSHNAHGIDWMPQCDSSVDQILYNKGRPPPLINQLNQMQAWHDFPPNGNPFESRECAASFNNECSSVFSATGNSFLPSRMYGPDPKDFQAANYVECMRGISPTFHPPSPVEFSPHLQPNLPDFCNFCSQDLTNIPSPSGKYPMNDNHDWCKSVADERHNCRKYCNGLYYSDSRHAGGHVQKLKGSIEKTVPPQDMNGQKYNKQKLTEIVGKRVSPQGKSTSNHTANVGFSSDQVSSIESSKPSAQPDTGPMGKLTFHRPVNGNNDIVKNSESLTKLSKMSDSLASYVTKENVNGNDTVTVKPDNIEDTVKPDNIEDSIFQTDSSIMAPPWSVYDESDDCKPVDLSIGSH